MDERQHKLTGQRKKRQLENVDMVDERHFVVGNDNNLPFSSSRDTNKADDNEFVLL